MALAQDFVSAGTSYRPSAISPLVEERLQWLLTVEFERGVHQPLDVAGGDPQLFDGGVQVAPEPFHLLGARRASAATRPVLRPACGAARRARRRSR